MSPPYLNACRCFVAPAARGGLSARDLASLAPGLSVHAGRELIQLLLDAGFIRPALAVDAWDGAYAGEVHTHGFYRFFTFLPFPYDLPPPALYIVSYRRAAVRADYGTTCGLGSGA